MKTTKPKIMFSNNLEAPMLPEEAQLSHDLQLEGCEWLDKYVEFSRLWSPRSFDGYHEAIGLWLLSTVAARRVSVQFGGERFTNLYILLVGRTSLYAKTTAVKIAKDLLSEIDLDFLLLPDETTPQRMVVDMASKLPEDWEKLSLAQKDEVKKSLAFTGQKGWYHDEFGQNLQSMMKKEGAYTDFRGLLRKLDDTGRTYEKATIGRGREVINRPYLALLGALTPADLATAASSGSILWGDGYLARMGLVYPPSGLFKEGKFPTGARVIPSELTDPIRQWHQRLGIPEVKITNGQLLPDKDLAVSILEPSLEVIEAFYVYDCALRSLLGQMTIHDFDGNYARFSEKALRIAALFANLSNSSEIQLHHWAKAQGITERWRRCLHLLYMEVSTTKYVAPKLTDGERVMKAIEDKELPTAREIQQYTGFSAERVNEILYELYESENVISEKAGKTVRYRLLPPKETIPPPDDYESQFEEPESAGYDGHESMSQQEYEYASQFDDDLFQFENE